MIFAHLGLFIGVVGFCICAAFSVCKGQQGDVQGRDENAYLAVAFLVVAVICGVLAAWW